MNILGLLNRRVVQKVFQNSIVNKLSNMRILFPKDGKKISPQKRIEQERFLATFYKRRYLTGTFVEGNYQNYHENDNPIIFVLFSGKKSIRIRTRFGIKSGPLRDYLEGINLKLLDVRELNYIMQLIISLNKPININGSYMIVSMKKVYDMIKFNQPLIIKKAYRSYHSEFCHFKNLSRGIYPAQIPIYKTTNNNFNMYFQVLNQKLNAINQTPIQKVLLKDPTQLDQQVENYLKNQNL